MRSFFCIIAAGLIIAVFFTLSPYVAENRKTEVSVVSAQKSNINDNIYVKGLVEEMNSEKIFPDSYGLVKEILVSQGDWVRKGQVIMRLQKINGSAGANDSQNTLTAEDINSYISQNLDLNSLDADSIAETFNNIQSDIQKSTQRPDSGEITNDIIEVKSTINGTVMEICEKNDIVSPSVSCARISDLNRLKVTANISENYIPNIKNGMKVDITGDAFDGILYKGVIKQIMPYAKPASSFSTQTSSSSNVDVMVEILNADKRLRPGYSANLKIYAGYKENTLLLPYEAVWQDNNMNECVYIVEDGRAVKKVIETGYELDDSIEVCKGILKDDMVILNPSANLRSGTAVRIKERLN